MILLAFHSVSVFIDPLGVENGIVSNKDITASSVYHLKYKPLQGRLNNLICWAAADHSTKFNTWLKIDLGQVMLVTRVATQGDPYWSFNYFTSFKLQFSFEGSKFSPVKEERSNTVKVSIMYT